MILTVFLCQWQCLRPHSHQGRPHSSLGSFSYTSISSDITLHLDYHPVRWYRLFMVYAVSCDYSLSAIHLTINIPSCHGLDCMNEWVFTGISTHRSFSAIRYYQKVDLGHCYRDYGHCYRDYGHCYMDYNCADGIVLIYIWSLNVFWLAEAAKPTKGYSGRGYSADI